MKWLTLEYIKQQLRIDPDFTLEDSLLESYGETAEETVLNLCNRTYDDVVSEYGCIPHPLTTAAAMLVDLSYQQRSPVSMQSMSVVGYAFDLQIKPYVRLASPSDTGDAPVQEFVLGSQMKIAVNAELPDGLTLDDVDFTVTVVNASAKDCAKDYGKGDCLPDADVSGAYVVCVDSDDLGVGRYVVRLRVSIPDSDFTSGVRREVIKIDPRVKVVA